MNLEFILLDAKNPKRIFRVDRQVYFIDCIQAEVILGYILWFHHVFHILNHWKLEKNGRFKIVGIYNDNPIKSPESKRHSLCESIPMKSWNNALVVNEKNVQKYGIILSNHFLNFSLTGVSEIHPVWIHFRFDEFDSVKPFAPTLSK